MGIKILLVDDHAVVRMGFQMLLNSVDDITVLAEASNGEEAVQLYKKYQPDVIVMDITMPGMGGLEAIERIVAWDRQAKILILSAHEDNIHPQRAISMGALGYLTKRSAPEELVKAIRIVAQRKPFLEADIAQQLAISQFSGKTPVDILSDREFEVFIELAKGRAVQEIAVAFNLSPRTVGTHLYNIKQKLNASNSVELTLIAIRAGLIVA